MAVNVHAFFPPLDEAAPVPGQEMPPELPDQIAPLPDSLPPEEPIHEQPVEVQEEAATFSLGMLLIGVGLLVLAALGVGTYYVISKKHTKPVLDEHKVSELKLYVTQLRMQGVDEAAIKDQLRKAQWPEAYIARVTQP